MNQKRLRNHSFRATSDEQTPKVESGRVSSHSESWGSGPTIRGHQVNWMQEYYGCRTKSTMGTEPRALWELNLEHYGF